MQSYINYINICISIQLPARLSEVKPRLACINSFNLVMGEIQCNRIVEKVI